MVPDYDKLFSVIMTIFPVKRICRQWSDKRFLATCHSLCAVIWYFTSKPLAIYNSLMLQCTAHSHLPHNVLIHLVIMHTQAREFTRHVVSMKAGNERFMETWRAIQFKLQCRVSVCLTMNIWVSRRYFQSQLWLYYLWQQWQIKHMIKTWQWIIKTIMQN